MQTPAIASVSAPAASMAAQRARGDHDERTHPPAHVVALFLKRLNLMARITERQRDRQGFGDLHGRLVAATTKQLRAEIRAERQQRKSAS